MTAAESGEGGNSVVCGVEPDLLVGQVVNRRRRRFLEGFFVLPLKGELYWAQQQKQKLKGRFETPKKVACLFLGFYLRMGILVVVYHQQQNFAAPQFVVGDNRQSRPV